MSYSKDFSIIIPCWRGAIQYLPKLFASIPESEGIEIIVVDNSKEPVRREEIDSNRNITLLHSAPERHAGGSRNDGMAIAKGKWLLFADADDYYSDDAFDIYYSMFDTDADIVYTGMSGIYADTGEPSDRGDVYMNKVHSYCIGEVGESVLRFQFSSPCCKMVSHSMVSRHNLRYDEIRASNDVYFSLTSGYYAKKIVAVDKATYIATVNRGSLTKLRDYEVTKSRYYAVLHCNKFKKEHGLVEYQRSVMYYLVESLRFGPKAMCIFIKMLFAFRQNPFWGWKHWISTMIKNKKNEKKDKKYFVK